MQQSPFARADEGGDGVRRRDLILLLASGAACLLWTDAHAQEPGRVYLLGFRGPVDRERDAAQPRCVFQGTQLLGRGDAGIGERRDMARSGNQLSQQFLPFTVKLGRETRMVCGP